MWLQVRSQASNLFFISHSPPLAAASRRDIYLFKDTSILPQHGTIELRGAQTFIRSDGPIFVSGAPARNRALQSGDLHADWPLRVSLSRKAEKLMSAAVCPYCRMPFDEASPPQIFCTACGMPHHEDCYRENGGCTVFGCKCAPADDPKLQVSQSDLQSVPMQPYAPSAQQYVPASAYVPPQPYRPSAYSGPLGLSQAAAPAPVQSPGMSAPASAPYTYGPAVPVGYQYGAYGQPRKSRSTYIVLGIFLGALGDPQFLCRLCWTRGRAALP